MTEDRIVFDEFCKLAIEGAKLLMQMAHNVETDIKYQQLLKNNVRIDALTFQREGVNISPTVHINSYFDRYKAGEDIQSIIKDIAETAYRAMEHNITLPEMTPEEATRCIRLDLVNYENNREMLESVPHYVIGEGEGALAAYPRWYISDRASFVVRNEVCGQLGLVPEELLQMASTNTQNMEYKLDSIGNVLMGMMGDIGTLSEEMSQMMDQQQTPQMLVLTTPDGCHGAAAMLSTEAMDRAKEMLGCDTVYVIPSSIHEVIIVPGDENGITPDILKDMIMDVNATELDPADILSDYPLKYDNKLSLAIEQPKMDLSQDLSSTMSRRMEMSM